MLYEDSCLPNEKLYSRPGALLTLRMIIFISSLLLSFERKISNGFLFDVWWRSQLKGGGGYLPHKQPIQTAFPYQSDDAADSVCDAGSMSLL